MLDQLLDIGKDQLGQMIKEKTGLDTSQAEQSVDIAGDSIMDGIKGEIAGGNISGLMGLLGDKSNLTADNPIISNIAGGFVKNLVSKLGISDSIASTISSVAIPFILSKFSDKAQDGSMMDLVSGFMDKDGDGKTDMSDLLGSFLGGGDAKDDKNPLDDLKGKLGGLF